MSRFQTHRILPLAVSLGLAAAAAVLFYEALRQRSTAANLSGNLGR